MAGDAFFPFLTFGDSFVFLGFPLERGDFLTVSVSIAVGLVEGTEVTGAAAATASAFLLLSRMDALFSSLYGKRHELLAEQHYKMNSRELALQ